MDVPQAVLQWDRGALEVECERAASVQQGVETYLGRKVFAADGETVVRVTLSRVDEHVVANVSQADATGKVWGERQVSGESDCASLDEPLTLVVALMVDSPRAEAEAAPPEAPPPEPEPTPSAPPPVVDDTSEIQTAPSLESSKVAPAHIAFLGLGAVAMGALPGAAVGGRAIATVKPRGFAGLGVDAELLAPQNKSLGAGSIDVSFMSVSGSLCPLQGVDGKTWYSACASFGAGRLRIEARDLLQARSRTEWVLLPSLAARAAWLPGRGVMIGGGLDAAIPLTAERYVYRDPQGQTRTAFDLAQLIVTASLGVGVLVD